MARRPSHEPQAQSASWYLLIHQLPPRPLYLRARIRQRLDRLGAVALKNSVYVLPARGSSLEDLEWVAQEAVTGGGEAYVCAAEFVVGLEAEDLRERFRERRAADYAELVAAVRTVLDAVRSRGRRAADDAASRLPRLKRRLQEIVALDFFDSPARAQAEAAVAALESRVHPVSAKTAPGHGRRSLVGKTWITRRGVYVDRIASAWLVRRFVDPDARFRFVDAETTPAREGEVRFDMVGGEFTHRGERCTFEDLVAELDLRQPGLADLAEIVHDIDLKDARFARPEATGVEQMIAGLCRAHPADADRLERGFQLFDDLHRAYAPPKRGAMKGTQPPKRGAMKGTQPPKRGARKGTQPPKRGARKGTQPPKRGAKKGAR